VTFEEGTQAQWLHDLLTPVVDQIVVCDRRGSPRIILGWPPGILATRRIRSRVLHL
jgi:hypothetical protein